MKKILLSLLSIGAVAVIAIVASQAFFSDTETSTGNVLQAGAIDLLVDNKSYVTNDKGQLVESPSTTWGPSDLNDGEGPADGAYLFFNFSDLKPGDIGEDTISLHVNNNDAWVCAAARITEDSDVSYTEPEVEPNNDPTVDLDNPSGTDGELAENVEIAFWADDGDNVLEKDEEEAIFLRGKISDLGQAGKIALADSTKNVWSDTGPLTGSDTKYIGKAWCFGNLTLNPVEQDDESDIGPLDRGTGFTCSGADSANNAAQTDRVKGDIQFYAVQSRNNPGFKCSTDYNPVWPTPTPSPSPTPT